MTTATASVAPWRRRGKPSTTRWSWPRAARRDPSATRPWPLGTTWRRSGRKKSGRPSGRSASRMPGSSSSGIQMGASRTAPGMSWSSGSPRSSGTAARRPCGSASPKTSSPSCSARRRSCKHGRRPRRRNEPFGGACWGAWRIEAMMQPAEPEASDQITIEELQLAARNHGMPLEALRYEITPVGLHYLLIHYDIPAIDPGSWNLTVSGRVRKPLTLSLDDILSRPAVTLPVTMECAGNGRARRSPRPLSQPWLSEAIGTGEWTGISLVGLLSEAEPDTSAAEVVFTGADHGVEGGVE